MSLAKLKQTGDTIIEVLLALAIISITLGSAYALANRSQQAGRYAQERTEAQKLAESQFEKLKSLVPDSTSNLFDDSTTFCINSSLTRTDFETPPPANRDDDDFSTYPDECISGLYHIAVTHTDTVTDQFLVSVRWDRLGGGKDEVTMQYRAHYISTANPIGPLIIPAPLVPPVPPASGNLECTAISQAAIKLDYSYANAVDASVFKGETLLETSRSSPDTYTDGGLGHGSTHTYQLRNGTSSNNTLLDTATCTTPNPPPPPPAASGSISCSWNVFVGMTINYSYSNGSSPSIWRDGTYIYNATSPSGSFVDNPSAGATYAYYLRNGQGGGSTVIASTSCYAEPFIFDWGGIDIWWCVTYGC